MFVAVSSLTHAESKYSPDFKPEKSKEGFDESKLKVSSLLDLMFLISKVHGILPLESMLLLSTFIGRITSLFTLKLTGLAKW